MTNDPKEELRKRLVVVAGESSVLAGWAANDMGDSATAWMAARHAKVSSLVPWRRLSMRSGGAEVVAGRAHPRPAHGHRAALRARAHPGPGDRRLHRRVRPTLPSVTAAHVRLRQQGHQLV